MMKIYLIISVIALLTVVIEMQFPSEIKDPFELFDTINEKLESINDEKVRSYFSNLINYLIENPLGAWWLMTLMCFTPIVHLVVIQNFVGKLLKKNKEI